MPQVYQPKPKADNTGKLLTIGGAIAGGVATGGSPQGIMMGAGAGQTAAGLTAKPQQAPTQVPVQQSAMQRKFQSQQQDPLIQLQESQAALATMPPEVQKAYKPQIDQAAYLEQQRRGMA